MIWYIGYAVDDVSGDACKSIIHVDEACLGPEFLAIAHVFVVVERYTGSWSASMWLVLG